MQKRITKITECVSMVKVFGEEGDNIYLIIDGSQEIVSIKAYGSNCIFSMDGKAKVISEACNVDYNVVKKEIKQMKNLDKNGKLNLSTAYSGDNKMNVYIETLHCKSSIVICKRALNGVIEIGPECDLEVNNNKYLSLLSDIKNMVSDEFFKFIANHYDYLGYEDGEYAIDLRVNDLKYAITMYLEPGKKDIVIRCDTSKSIESLKEFGCDEDVISTLSVSYDKLVNDIKNMGFNFYYSHDQSEDVWGWSDIVVPCGSINREILLNVIKAVSEHESVVYDVADNF